MLATLLLLTSFPVSGLPDLEVHDTNGFTGLYVQYVESVDLKVRSPKNFFAFVSRTGRIGQNIPETYLYADNACSGERYLPLQEIGGIPLFSASFIAVAPTPYYVPADGGLIDLPAGSYFERLENTLNCNPVSTAFEQPVQRQLPNDPSITGFPDKLTPPLTFHPSSEKTDCVFANGFECPE